MTFPRVTPLIFVRSTDLEPKVVDLEAREFTLSRTTPLECVLRFEVWSDMGFVLGWSVDLQSIVGACGLDLFQYTRDFVKSWYEHSE